MCQIGDSMQEMKQRVYTDEETVPERVDDYYYYTKMRAADNFLQYCRKKGLNGPEEVLLDTNQEGQHVGYIGIGVVKVSRDHSLLMYTMDSTAEEKYDLYIKDLQTKQLLKVQSNSFQNQH
jgi:oligopeptidase B